MCARSDIVEIEINPIMLGADFAICADALITVIDENAQSNCASFHTANSDSNKRSD
jgi:succinyl-CoA synthetase beta subunit